MRENNKSKIDTLYEILFSLFEEKSINDKEAFLLLATVDDEKVVAKFGEEGAVMALISIFRMFDKKAICLRAALDFFDIEE